MEKNGRVRIPGEKKRDRLRNCGGGEWRVVIERLCPPTDQDYDDGGTDLLRFCEDSSGRRRRSSSRERERGDGEEDDDDEEREREK